MVWTGTVDIFHAFLIAGQVGYRGPEILAAPADVQAGHIKFPGVCEETPHDLPAGDPIGLLRGLETHTAACELIRDAAAR